ISSKTMKLSAWVAVSHFTVILSASLAATRTTKPDCFFNVKTNETWKVVWEDNFNTGDLSRDWLIEHETNYCSGRLNPTDLSLHPSPNSIYRPHREWTANAQLQHESNRECSNQGWIPGHGGQARGLL